MRHQHKDLYHSLLLVAVMLLSLTSWAQSPTTLDRAIEKLSAKEGLQVSFRMTLEEETIDGKYYAQGRKFYYHSEPIRAWYDGTDLWVYIKQSGEVNLSTPHKEDLVEINPLLNLEGISKQRFTIKEQIDGQNVRLTATPCKKYKGALKRLVALFTTEGRPLSLTIEEKGLEQPIRIEVTSFEEGPYKELKSNSFFKFTPAKVPGATLIDLR